MIDAVHADGAPTVQPLWYSGTVSDGAKVPLTGNHKVTLRLFDSDAPTAAALCVMGPADVRFDEGHFRVDVSLCDDKKPTATLFASKADLFVELTVDDASKPFALAKVGATPYALEAQNAAAARTAADPLAQQVVPAGMIAMFGGACPAGWAEYTPLRGRVPRGEPAGDLQALDSGGTDDLIVVSHSHPVQARITGGEHVHPYTDPGHQHGPPGGWNFLTGGGGDPGCSAMLPVGSGFDCGRLTTSSTVKITIQSASHTHDLSTTTGTSGSSGVGANMQAFREVIFCIKS